ncbi:MAG: ABC transporter permease [Pseudonocardia sp.]|nr:ABC transporter permease [Pseudonocardia sp.]
MAQPITENSAPGGPSAPRPGTPLLSLRIVTATARRVLTQLRNDRRTVALLVVVPSVLMVLINQMLDSRPDFDRVGLSLLGVFPFTMMFLVTSVAMLRERTSGTLERLLTTPMSKLDLLAGYGLAFTVAAAAQALVACATAYWLLGLYTPGSAWLVVTVALVSAALGMALGLLGSAFATSEFQAVQFMPALVMPQILLGGLFVPREQMANWLYAVSSALPMTYGIEALGEVGKTALITAKLVRDVGIMLAATIITLCLAAATLRRRTGPPSAAARRARRVAPVAVMLVSALVMADYGWANRMYVWTDNAQIDALKIPLVAPATGTLFDWHATQGVHLRANQIVGYVKARSGAIQTIIRAPSTSTVVHNNVVSGMFVTAGAQLAVAYDLTDVYVTARIDETDIGGVRPGQPVDITVDAYPGRTFTGLVWQVQNSTAELFSARRHDTSTGVTQKLIQRIPVKIAIVTAPDTRLIPGMNVTVKIHKR